MATDTSSTRFGPGVTGLTDSEGRIFPLPGRESELLKLSDQFFSPLLTHLKLAEWQIREQSLPDLKRSLDAVSDAISRPDSFGTFSVGIDVRGQMFIANQRGSAVIQNVGVLPLLIERKQLILELIARASAHEKTLPAPIPPINVSAIGPTIDIVAWVKYFRSRLFQLRK